MIAFDITLTQEGTRVSLDFCMCICAVTITIFDRWTVTFIDALQEISELLPESFSVMYL